MSSKTVSPPYPLHSPSAVITVSPHGGGGGKRTLNVFVDFGACTRVGFEPGDLLLHRVGHRRLGGLGPEPVDDALHPGDLLGLQRRLPDLPGLVLGTGALVLRVRAAVLEDLADCVLGRAVEVQHPGDRLVEQFEVVADHEQRTLVLPQEPEQPGLRVDVEVVGRLVEAQHVGAGEEDAGEFDTAPLAAGQHAERQIEAIVGKPETDRHRPRLAVGGVPAGGAEHLLGLEVPADIALVGVLLHGDAQLLDPDDLVVDALAGQDVGDAGATVEVAVDLRILREVTEAALAQHLAGRGLVGAAEHLEQAGLAGTVAADDADLVAGHDGEAGAVDQQPPSHFDRDGLRLQHLDRLRSHPTDVA